MKFCYADESGHHADVVVVAGVVVDAIRMRRTKSEWHDILSRYAERYGRPMPEFKARELHRGKGSWHALDGPARKAIVGEILDWMQSRKHRVTFGAVSRQRLAAQRDKHAVGGLASVTEWSIAAMHLVLSVQKFHKNAKNNKGDTLFVFDHVHEDRELQSLILNPPPETDGFYDRASREERLNQVVDVPYFADSRHAGLIQVADFCAYIIRLYEELTEGRIEEGFKGEEAQLREWMAMMRPILMPDAVRWPRRSKDPCVRFLRSIAPPSLLSVT